MLQNFDKRLRLICPFCSHKRATFYCMFLAGGVFMLAINVLTFGLFLALNNQTNPICKRPDLHEIHSKFTQDLRGSRDGSDTKSAQNLQGNVSKFADNFVWKRVEVRAYCPCKDCCGIHANGKTATGSDAYSKGIAGYPVFPYKTSLYVPGYGWARVDDTGGVVRSRHKNSKIYIEVRFPSHKKALNWGVKFFYIKMLGERSGYKKYTKRSEGSYIRRWRLQRHCSGDTAGKVVGTK